MLREICEKEQAADVSLLRERDKRWLFVCLLCAIEILQDNLNFINKKEERKMTRSKGNCKACGELLILPDCVVNCKKEKCSFFSGGYCYKLQGCPLGVAGEHEVYFTNEYGFEVRNGKTTNYKTSK